jgi:hypothetical protein
MAKAIKQKKKILHLTTKASFNFSENIPPPPMLPLEQDSSKCHVHNTQRWLLMLANYGSLTQASLKFWSAAHHSQHLVPVPTGLLFLSEHTIRR